MSQPLSVFPVIMCGGAGTRLWPVSRPGSPKQFVPIVGEQSLFQQALHRVCGVKGFQELVIVAGMAHSNMINRELADLHINYTLLLEPEGRESAPAIAAATAYIERTDPNGVALIVASDHHIPETQMFQDDVHQAVQAANSNSIITMGITPTGPNSAYGYIRPAFKEGTIGPLDAFVEKPDKQTAARYIDDGYLWNSGNFVAKARTLSQAFQDHAPQILTAAQKGLKTAYPIPGGLVLGPAFISAPKISFDYAVMENHKDRQVVRSFIKWSDLGAWDTVHKAMPKDEQGNSVHGDAVLIDTKDCHIRTPKGQTAVVSDIQGLNVIIEDDVVFVSPLKKAQKVKQTVDHLKALKRPEIDIAPSDFNIGKAADRWGRWLKASALPLWWAMGFDHEKGLWRETLHCADGQPTGADSRARVQGRQSFVYARAGQKGWCGPWQQAFTSGLKAVQTYYAGKDGLMCTCVDKNGTVKDDQVLLYDQTFVLLALAQAENARNTTQAQALDLLSALQTRFSRNDGQGFKEAGAYPYQSNAHMHFFEALMAWVEVKGDAIWFTLAQEIVTLALTKMIDPEKGFIREFYTADWRPAEGADGRIVEPGHQFEWAWLLTRWVKISNSQEAQVAAELLFKNGLSGIDMARGVALDRLNDQLHPATERARLWPQTEWLKAACLLANCMDHNKQKQDFYNAQVAKAAHSVDQFLNTPLAGLWYDKMQADGSFENEPAPASSFYHIFCAIEALQEWSERQPKEN